MSNGVSAPLVYIYIFFKKYVPGAQHFFAPRFFSHRAGKKLEGVGELVIFLVESRSSSSLLI